tara:strand:- start:5221 stop:5604 length:384 start_codon:yes stop_codon:yes gene_type:complete
MKIVNVKDITGTKYHVDWGNGTSRRMIVKADGMGYSVHYTITYRGTSSTLEYKNHLESCYVLSGSGTVEAHGKIHKLQPGDMYVLDQHDKHIISADAEQDMVTLCIFNPACEGTENHNLKDGEASGY